MPRKKAAPTELTTLLLDGPGATGLLDQRMESCAASETALLNVAQPMAGQAITPEHTPEADRVKAAEPQRRLRSES